MTNEELAALAKAGDRAALGALWEQNRGLLRMMLRKLEANPASCARMDAAGVTFDDLMQESFFAVERAALLYDPTRGASFASFLAYAVKHAFFDAVGLRTSRQRADPLCNADSLDRPLTNSDGLDGLTRADAVPDEAAVRPFSDVEERLFAEQLHAALDKCLDAIPQKDALIIRARYYDGRTQSQIAAALGCSGAYIGQMENHGLRKLRSPCNRHRLAQYREEIISRHATRSTGFSAWKRHGSAPERIVEGMERRGLL